MDLLIKKILLKKENEKKKKKNIKEFVGNNCCQKCYKNSKKPLTYVMSFNKSKGSYFFIDLPGANYKLTFRGMYS